MLNLNKSTLPKKYSKSNKIYLTENKFKDQSTRKKYSNYFTQSQFLKSNLRKNQSCPRTNSSINLVGNYNYQPVQKIYKI